MKYIYIYILSDWFKYGTGKKGDKETEGKGKVKEWKIAPPSPGTAADETTPQREGMEEEEEEEVRHWTGFPLSALTASI